MIDFILKVSEINKILQSIKDIKQSNNKSKIFCLLFFNNNLYISSIGDGIYFFKKLCKINYTESEITLIKSFDYDEFNSILNIFNNDDEITCIFNIEKNELKISKNSDKKVKKNVTIKSIEYNEIYNEKELILNNDSLYNLYLNSIDFFSEKLFNVNDKISLSFFEYLYNVQKTINLMPKNFSTLETCLHITDSEILSLSRSELTRIYSKNYELSLLNINFINILDIKTLTYIINICKKNNAECLSIKKDKNKFIIYTNSFILILSMLNYEAIPDSRFRQFLSKIHNSLLLEEREIKFSCDLNIFNEIFNIRDIKEDDESYQRIKFILNNNSNILKVLIYESKNDERNNEIDNNKYLFEFDVEINNIFFDEILSKFMKKNNYNNFSIIFSKNILTNNSINILKQSDHNKENIINISIKIEKAFDDKIFNNKNFFVSINFINEDETILVRKMATIFCRFN